MILICDELIIGPICYIKIFAKGVQLHHPRGRSTDVSWLQDFSALLQLQPSLMGWWLLKSITWRWKCHLKYEMTMIISSIQLVLQVWYDRKDSRSMAISVSPQTSLFLGLHKFFFSFWSSCKCPRAVETLSFSFCSDHGANIQGTPKRVKTIALPLCSIPELSTTNYLSVQFVSDQGVHNVDFSGVRDDKCHTGVGESRVTHLTSCAAPIVYIWQSSLTRIQIIRHGRQAPAL